MYIIVIFLRHQNNEIKDKSWNFEFQSITVSQLNSVLKANLIQSGFCTSARTSCTRVVFATKKDKSHTQQVFSNSKIVHPISACSSSSDCSELITHRHKTLKEVTSMQCICSIYIPLVCHYIYATDSGKSLHTTCSRYRQQWLLFTI